MIEIEIRTVKNERGTWAITDQQPSSCLERVDKVQRLGYTI
ncbi:hypothetical protein [Neobacillus niacini]|nr:hypothetical protein [Neobacillus niacini]MDR7000996.1 hypothetical protein [Neobacillus niacini]